MVRPKINLRNLRDDFFYRVFFYLIMWDKKFPKLTKSIYVSFQLQYIEEIIYHFLRILSATFNHNSHSQKNSKYLNYPCQIFIKNECTKYDTTCYKISMNKKNQVVHSKRPICIFTDFLNIDLWKFLSTFLKTPWCTKFFVKPWKFRLCKINNFLKSACIY